MDIPSNVFTEWLVAALSPWIAGGLGIGLALLAIYSGWSIVRDLATGSREELTADDDDDTIDRDEEEEEEDEQ